MNNYFIQLFHIIPRTWFTNPGFIVRKLTNPKTLQPKINTLEIKFTIEEVMKIKQFFCNFIFLYFFFYILFTGNFFKGIFLDLSLCMAISITPEICFNRYIKRRKSILQKQLPDFIDALTIAIESGMNFVNAFTYLSKKQKGLLGKEAQKTNREIEFGIPIEEAMQNMSQRINIEEFSKFVTSIKQAKKLGVSIAETLRIQSNLIRTRRRQKAEELSRTASVKISIPLVFCIFPALLIVYLGPGLLRLIEN